MTIWILGGILVLAAAALGYFLGAIRAGICLLGAILGAAFAKVVGGWMAGLVPTLGFTNPLWQFYLPPVFGYVVLSIVFLIIAVVLHHYLFSSYRNRSDEYSFARWDRLNRRTGVALGAVLGAVWTVLVAIVGYVPGYFTSQFADAEDTPWTIKAATLVSRGTQETGLNRLVEFFQPASAEHYLASDILGLVYANPALHSRLASYPPFLGLAEKTEVAELAKDPEVNTLIQSQAGLNTLLQNAKLRAVIDNPDLVNELLGLSFEDLNAYLRTGVSEKFKDEHILGRWRLNVRRSIAEMKNVAVDKLPAVEFNLLRKALNVFLEDMTIGFTTDNKAILKVKAKDEQKLLQTVGRSAPAPAAGGAAGEGGAPASEAGTGPGLSARNIAARAVPAAPANDTYSDAATRQRYGLSPTGRGGAGGRPGGAGGAPVAQAMANTSSTVVVRQPAKAPASTALALMMSNGEGAWSKNSDTYKVNFSKDGKELSLEVAVKENALVATVNGRTLVFERI